MTSLIERLWLAGNLPIKDGLYRADGTAYGLQADSSAPGGIKILPPFSLEEFLAPDPEMVTSIDVTLEKPLDGEAGYACCGETSWGSDGFFGRLGQRKDLAWVVFLEDCNPFVDAVVSGTTVTFTSSSGVVITVDLEAPEFRL